VFRAAQTLVSRFVCLFQISSMPATEAIWGFATGLRPSSIAECSRVVSESTVMKTSACGLVVNARDCGRLEFTSDQMHLSSRAGSSW
jgi:hypothetical protein